jgi:hypothetical protein
MKTETKHYVTFQARGLCSPRTPRARLASGTPGLP